MIDRPLLSLDGLKLSQLLQPFAALADRCEQMTYAVAGSFRHEEQTYLIPRVVVRGPAAAARKRIGIFSLLHGDEAAPTLALLQLLETLAAEPALATGYDIVVYPLCNPTGYEASTRHNRADLDLNREFWRDSEQPEIQILERELLAQAFDGIIALHADDTCNGLYGYTHGRVLNENLLLPALRASSAVLPLDCRPTIDGFPAREGVICDCFRGILAPPPQQTPRPFEIIFETPANTLPQQQAAAAHLALLSILKNYREFIAYAQDI